MSRTTYSYSRSNVPGRRRKKSNFNLLIIITLVMLVVYVLSLEITPSTEIISENINGATQELDDVQQID